MNRTRKPAASKRLPSLPGPSASQATVLRFRWIGVIVAVVAVVFALPLLLVWQSMATLKLAKRNDRLQTEIEKIHTENALIQVQVDELLSPRRIEERARKELGLSYPLPRQIMFVSADSTWNPLPGGRSEPKEGHASRQGL
jgi:cell division protein FtsL